MIEEKLEKQAAIRQQSQINSILLFGSKETINLYDFHISTQIFEDLFSNSVSGHIMLRDAGNIVREAGLKGYDRILFVFDYGKEKLVREFFVYSHSTSSNNVESAEVLNLYFISFPTILSQHTRLWNAFSGDVKSIVSNVFDNCVRGYIPLENTNDIPPAQTPRISISQTMGNIKFVSAGWTPFETINWLAGRSTCSQTSSSFFLFYETLKDGFYFESIEKAIYEKNTIELDKQYVFVYDYFSTGNSYNTIKEMHVSDLMDTLQGTEDKYLTLWHNDLIYKKIHKHNFDYNTSARPILNSTLLGTIDDSNPFNFNFTNRHNEGNFRAIVKNESAETHNGFSSYNGTSFARKYSTLQQLNLVRVTIECFENYNVQVGSVVELFIPKKKGNNADESIESLKDSVLSGRYIVSSKKHNYIVDEATMELELVKESVL